MSVRHWQILCGVLTVGLAVKQMVKDHNNLVELGAFLLNLLNDKDVTLDEFEQIIIQHHLREQE